MSLNTTALSYTLLDGKTTSAEIKKEITSSVEELKSRGQRPPHLAAVLVGDDPASHTYVGAKVKACKQVGFESTLVELSKETSEEQLLQKVNELNADPAIDGYIVQLPLPDHINEQKITEAISSDKDVDGFHPVNVGRMNLDLPAFLPATPYGIIQLLDRYGVETEGKHCVIIGRSKIVGLPITILMARKANPGNCTVTLTHSRTKDLRKHTLQADIIIAAMGKPGFLNADMVKEGAVVIDVGISRVADDSKKSGYRLTGDVKFDEVAPKCSFITPVPGGVGPMTIASLLGNTLQAYRRRMEL